MYNKVPTSRLYISMVAGETPSVEEVANAGACINAADMKLYHMVIKDEVTVSAISIELLMKLTGMVGEVSGPLQLTNVSPMTGTRITIDDIGTIVSAGDMIQLPHGVRGTVLFVTNDDSLVIKESLNPVAYEHAQVLRYPARVSELSRPTELSLLWEEVASTLDAL